MGESKLTQGYGAKNEFRAACDSKRNAWFNLWDDLPVSDGSSCRLIEAFAQRLSEACASKGRSVVVRDAHDASAEEEARALLSTAHGLAPDGMALVTVPGALTASVDAQTAWDDLAQHNIVAAVMEMPAMPVDGWRARTLPYVAFVLDAARKPEMPVAIMRFNREFLLPENAGAARNVVRVAANVPRFQLADEERAAQMTDEATDLLVDLVANPRVIAGVSCLVNPTIARRGGRPAGAVDSGAAEASNAAALGADEVSGIAARGAEEASDARGACLHAPLAHASYCFDDYAHDVRFGMGGVTLYEAGKARYAQWKTDMKAQNERWDAQVAAEEEAMLEGQEAQGEAHFDGSR